MISSENDVSLPFVYLTEDIWNEILQYALSHDRETGGVVIGYLWNDPQSQQPTFLIQYISDEGKHINGSDIHFTGDMEYFSQLVVEWQEKVDADFLGIWHSHPPGFNHLSDGDIKSAFRVFEANERLTYFLAPLVVFSTDEERELLFFYLQKAQKTYLQIPFMTNIKVINAEEFESLQKMAIELKNNPLDADVSVIEDENSEKNDDI